jgi:nitroreductase
MNSRRYVIDLFEAIHTQRAIRLYTSDPVSEEDIRKILTAATHAPNGGNRQPWHFLVVRGAELRKKLGDIFWAATQRNRGKGGHFETPTYLRSGYDFAQHIGESPVLIIACVNIGTGDPFRRGASIYPAIQNLMLAARGLGIGSCYTSNIFGVPECEQETKKLLGIPDDVIPAGMIPLGHLGPGEHFGGAMRKPLEEVVSYEQWGQQHR